MTDLHVPSGTSVKLRLVEGELKAGRNVTIRPESGGKVIVTAGASFEGPVTIECDFECASLRVEGRGYGPGGDVNIKGGLTVHGRADINSSVKVTGDTKSEDLDVSGHFESSSLTSKGVRVGGHMTTSGDLKAESVDVGGHMRVRGEVEMMNLRVGGHVEIEGGTIAGEIKVRGHFISTKKLNFGQIEVFGKLRLGAGSNGQRLTALGTVTFDGDASCNVLNISGTTQVRGKCTAQEIEVKGRLNVSESLNVSKRLRVYGTTEAGGGVECGELGVLGRLAAESLTATGHVDISGEVKTRVGIKASSILIGRGSKIIGPLIGDEIEVGSETDFGSMWGLPWWRSAIGRPTTIQDAYGQTVTIEARSIAKRIFAEVVEMHEGSTAEQITYTKDLKLPRKYSLHQPPMKVTRLPEPPL